MRHLTKRLEAAVVVDPKTRSGDQVFFGATVLVEDEDGVQSTYVVVGEDEIDSKNGRISWRSPVGRSLLGKRAGDIVVVRRPAGEIELELVDVRYV
jgi:transcription elongation factor GreB